MPSTANTEELRLRSLTFGSLLRVSSAVYYGPIDCGAKRNNRHRPQDSHDQPINLVRIPNSAVSKVFFTERTPEEALPWRTRHCGASCEAAGRSRLSQKKWTAGR